MVGDSRMEKVPSVEGTCKKRGWQCKHWRYIGGRRHLWDQTCQMVNFLGGGAVFCALE